MPRRRLPDSSSLTAHVMNRGARKLRLFESPGDYEAFLAVLEAGRINHFHLLLRTTRCGQLAEFMRWTQTTHAKRWRGFRASQGAGYVYQGRYRAVAVQTDQHFLVAARYVERNPVRAGLVEKAEMWLWSSLGQESAGLRLVSTSPWPVDRPHRWSNCVNTDAGGATDMRAAVTRGVPFGEEQWATRTFGQTALRSRGRPSARKKHPVLFQEK